MYYLLIILIIIAIIMKNPKIKGKIGETSLSLQLKRLDEESYKLINDIYLDKGNGKTTQIDHVVISEYGVFVIETKNYQGWITGYEDSQYWNQTIYKRKEKLYNPIKQNYGHILALKEVLKDYPNIPFVSIIAFTIKATLKVKTESHVVYTTQVVKTIKNYTEKVISKDDVQKIYELIMSERITDEDITRDHVHNIKQSKQEKEHKIENNTCPWCGGELKSRKGKYGTFKGCSNYPRCKFTAK